MKILVPVILLSIMLVAGCASGVQRVDPNAADEVNTKWDIKDVNLIAATMIQSLENHRLAYKNPPAVILVLQVKNKTYEHLDTKAITETIVTALLKSGKYRVVAEKDMRAALEAEVEYKKATTEGGGDDGELSLATIKQYKSKVGTDLVMYGELVGIEKRDGGTKDVSYKMTLKLVDIESTLVEWQDQKDIRKQQSSGLFGS